MYRLIAVALLIIVLLACGWVMRTANQPSANTVHHLAEMFGGRENKLMGCMLMIMVAD